MAISDNIFRFKSTLALIISWINRLYDNPCALTAAEILAIHSRRKSLLRCRRPMYA